MAVGKSSGFAVGVAGFVGVEGSAVLASDFVVDALGSADEADFAGVKDFVDVTDFVGGFADVEDSGALDFVVGKS